MYTFLIFALLAIATFVIAARRAATAPAVGADGTRSAPWHSLPSYHGIYVAGLAVAPAFLIWVLWALFGGMIVEALVARDLPPDVAGLPAERFRFFMDNVARLGQGQDIYGQVTPSMEAMAESYAAYASYGLIVTYLLAAVLLLVGAAMGLRAIGPNFRARNTVEGWVRVLLVSAATISILTTFGIVFSVLVESLRFFARVPFTEFLFGMQWSPQTALRVDQVGSSGAFGAVPLFAGTLLITVIAMLVAGPLGLLSAIYLSEYASPAFRSWAKPVVEILAGIPTVVYGFFAALTVAPFLRDAGASIGLDVSSESALAAGGVMGIMIIPFVSSLADDALSAVPQSLRDASYGMGATTSETIRQVVFPAALPGIIAGFLLAISRAIGETMIVVMAAGLAANLTANPFEAVTTVTVQIVTLLTGDQEFDSAKTLAAFALGLVLFAGTLILNVIALYVLHKYRERYD